MVNYCVAFNCRIQAGQGYSFHKFPNDEHLCKVWCHAIKRENFKPTQYSRICSQHFTKDDYDPKAFGHPTLRKGSIPSVFEFPENVGRTQIKKSSPLNRRNEEIPLSSSAASALHSSAPDKGLCDTKDGIKILNVESLKVSRKRKTYSGDFEDSDLSSPEYPESVGRTHIEISPLNIKNDEEIPLCSSTASAPDNGHSSVCETKDGIKILSVESLKTSHKRRAYFGDFNEKDLASPIIAEKYIELVSKEFDKKSKIIADLRRKNRRLNEKVRNLQALIDALREKMLVGEDAGITIKKET